MKQAIKSLIGKITGKETVTETEKLRAVAIGCLVVHVLLLELFTITNVFVMVVYNLLVIAFYMYIISTIKRKEYFKGYLLTYGEIGVSVIMGTIIVGFQSGFWLYVLTVCISSFCMIMSMSDVRKKLYIPFIICFGSLVLVIVLYVITKGKPLPMLAGKVSDGWMSVYFIFNVCVTFLFVIALMHGLVLDMINSSDDLLVQNKALEHTASVDPLTGLMNRRSMETTLEDAMDRAKQRGTLFSLIMGDIDNFKRINDTYGHECGDRALEHVAEVMLRCVRDGDVICRWGGEEFLILVRGNQEIAVTVADRIRTTIEKEVITYNDQKIPFTITFGVTSYVPGYRMETLIRQADDHLYIGKTTGKNKVVV